MWELGGGGDSHGKYDTAQQFKIKDLKLVYKEVL